MTSIEPSPIVGLEADAWAVLEQLARCLRVEDAALQPTLDAIVEQAVITIDVAEFAGLITLDHGRLEPRATLGEPPNVLDELQRRVGSGPCVDAAREQMTFVLDDTLTDSRWPVVAAAAVKLDVRSMLCVPLWAGVGRLGALSLYSPKPQAFSEHHQHLIGLYATFAALALADASRTDQLKRALANRDTIGQAKGILMYRHRIAPEQAFTMLSHVSQTTNSKLLAVAEHVVATGELPS